MQTTQKMKTTAKRLLTLYQEERRDLRRTGNYQSLSCIPKLDRLVLTARAVSIQALCEIPGFRPMKPQRLWDHLYGRRTRIRGTGSVCELIVESEPNARWLPRFRIVIVPRDTSGLSFDDLRCILELIPQFKIVLAEVAFDFPIRSLLDPPFVRHHMLCGKTWLRSGTNPLHERYGRARSSKTVRVYVKFEASIFRIELELHARFLREHRINHASDFAKLVQIVPTRHIHFAQLDEAKLRKHLLRSVPSQTRRKEIVEAVARRKKNLWATLRYLRQYAKLTNVRRLLVPLVSMNTLVTNALVDWARQWSSAPTRLNPTASESERTGLSGTAKVQNQISTQEGEA